MASDLAFVRLQQALDMDRIGYFRAQKLHDAADLFHLSGRQDIADLCDKAAKRFWGDNTELEKLCST
jgi:hypothetical protein